jgi:hypothetical protein
MRIMTPDQLFVRELEIFRKEEESGAQFFYAELALHAVAYENKQVHALLNTAPLFWNTCAGALQTAAFMALGRVFDQQSNHNVDTLLRIAQQNLAIFSKDSLAQRKQATSAERPEWLDEYLRSVYVPTADDFRRLRLHIKRRRRIYESNYRDLRHKFFAHKEVADEADTAVLFGKGTIGELQRLFAFLGALHEALWQLYFNGQKPTLRPRRYSVKRMRDVPSPFLTSATVQERILHETERFLVSASTRVMAKNV